MGSGAALGPSWVSLALIPALLPVALLVVTFCLAGWSEILLFLVDNYLFIAFMIDKFDTFTHISMNVLIFIHHQVVGAAVGLAFALPEAIEIWKDQIKKNHVTEASQSLRDTADAILKISRTLRKQFNGIEYEIY